MDRAARRGAGPTLAGAPAGALLGGSEHFRRSFALAGLTALALAISLGVLARSGGHQPSPPNQETSKSGTLDSYGELPLSFIPNRGQTDASVRYYAQGAGFSFYFQKERATLAFERERKGSCSTCDFVARTPTPRSFRLKG